MTRRVVINHRDGGIGRRGPWWVQTIYPLISTVFAHTLLGGGNTVGGL